MVLYDVCGKNINSIPFRTSKSSQMNAWNAPNIIVQLLNDQFVAKINRLNDYLTVKLCPKLPLPYDDEQIFNN